MQSGRHKSGTGPVSFALGGSNTRQQLLEAITEGGEYGKRLEKVVRLLDALGQSALNTIKTSDGVPVLNYAIMTRNFDIAKLLVQRGVNCLLRDRDGQTAVHAAAEMDNTELLLDMLPGCDINVQDNQGETPLHVAVRNSSVESVKCLVFAGACPLLPNTDGVVCRVLTQKDQIHQILREYAPDRHTILASLDAESSFATGDVQFTMQLPSYDRDDTRAFSGTLAFLYCVCVPDPELLGEDDDVQGPALEYRFGGKVRIHFVVPRWDVMNDDMELVLRLTTDAGGFRDSVLELQEGSPWPVETASEDLEGPEADDTVSQTGRLGSVTDVTSLNDEHVSANQTDAAQGAHGAGVASRTSDTPEKESEEIKENGLAKVFADKERIVSHARTTVELEAAGTVLLVVRPKLQLVNLDREHPEVTSAINKEVKLTTMENFRGSIQANLQLEHSAPLRPLPALSCEQMSEQSDQEGDVEAQSDYFKLIFFEVGADGVVKFITPPPGDVDHTTWVYARVKSSRSCSQTTDSENEADDVKEAGRWVKVPYTVQKVTGKIQLPVIPNKTMTVVGAKRSVSDEKIKKRLGKQYRKRRHKEAVFFVLLQPFQEWRNETSEMVVGATSKKLLSAELNRQLKKGYRLEMLTGDVRVPDNTVFRLTVQGDLFVEKGPEADTLLFQTGPARKGANLCMFLVRRKKSARFTCGIQIEKQVKGKKSGSSPDWTKLGSIDLSHLAPVNEKNRSKAGRRLYTAPRGPKWPWPFTDPVLLELAEKVYPSQTQTFGISLGLPLTKVDQVMCDDRIKSPVYRLVQVLRLVRDECDSPVAFGIRLNGALRQMGWNEQREWLYEKLTDWDKLREIKGSEGMASGKGAPTADM